MILIGRIFQFLNKITIIPYNQISFSIFLGGSTVSVSSGSLLCQERHISASQSGGSQSGQTQSGQGDIQTHSSTVHSTPHQGQKALFFSPTHLQVGTVNYLITISYCNITLASGLKFYIGIQANKAIRKTFGLHP